MVLDLHENELGDVYCGDVAPFWQNWHRSFRRCRLSGRRGEASLSIFFSLRWLYGSTLTDSNRFCALICRNVYHKRWVVAFLANDGSVVTDSSNLAQVLLRVCFSFLWGKSSTVIGELSANMNAPHFTPAAVQKEYSVYDPATLAPINFILLCYEFEPTSKRYLYPLYITGHSSVQHVIWFEMPNLQIKGTERMRPKYRPVSLNSALREMFEKLHKKAFLLFLSVMRFFSSKEQVFFSRWKCLFNLLLQE